MTYVLVAGTAAAFILLVVVTVFYVIHSGGIGADDDRKNWP